MIAFTSDIDWAPEAVIQDMLDIFSFYNVKCTLFATHASDVVKNADSNLFEVALHPNFNPLLQGGTNKPALEILEDLKTFYPNATGIRSHSMTQSSPLLQMFKRSGLLYDSNHFLPYMFDIKPFYDWNGLLRIPYNWEDDIHFMYGKSFTELDVVNYGDDGFLVFDFHPIHVYLNTIDEAHYLNAKPSYHDAEALKPFVNTGGAGVRDYLINTLEYIKKQGYRTFTLQDIYTMTLETQTLIK